MSLTKCRQELKKAGTPVSPVDDAAIIDRARALRGEGLNADDAARQAVAEQLAAVRAMLPQRETITPADDKSLGKNEAGEALYERADGSVYRMHAGKPDFGGDLVSRETPAAAADGVTRAVAGGQEGINGEWYEGGQILPTSSRTVKGEYRVTKEGMAAGHWKVVDEIGQTVRTFESQRAAEESASSLNASGPEGISGSTPAVDASIPITEGQSLAGAGLVVEQKQSQRGKTYWTVTGNTRDHEATLDALGFGRPFKMGGKWYRSVFDADPTERLVAALQGAPVVAPAGSPAAELPSLPADEAAIVLRQHKIEIVPPKGDAQVTDGIWTVTGRGTFDAKDTIKQVGGKWDGYAKAWSFKTDPTGTLAAALKERGVPGAAGDDAGAGDSDAEIARRRELREREDARADERADAGAVAGLISVDTQALIRRGEKFGIPAKVLNEQIEDAAMLVQAFEREKPLFLLANEAGTGKTLVLGAAIRELRKRGQTKFVYVTLNTDLIAQIKKDLADYGVDDVSFHTYSELSTKGFDTTDAVLIFDEAHNIKNVGGETVRADKAQNLIAASKFPIFASATLYENPVEARYLGATSLFDPVGGFNEWAKMYGAAVKVRKFYNPNTGRQQTEEIIYWAGRGKKEDGAAARQWLLKQGILTQRPMTIDPKKVNVEFRRIPVADAWVAQYQQVSDAYDAATDAWRDENGNPRDYKIVSEISRHRENTIKRVLEASKIEGAIKEAKSLLADGRNVVIFVETKADRHLGRWRKSEFLKDDTLYTYDQMQEMLAEWQAEKNMALMQHEKPPPRPFAEFITEIARFFDAAGIDTELPSTADQIVKAIGADKVAIYTGAVSNTAAAKNKADFMAGRKTVLVATMAKGGTGLSLHDTVGNRPTTQLNINLPWKATSVDQVSARVARYGLASNAEVRWLFAQNIPWESNKLAPRVGARMRDMGAIVKGLEVKAAEILDGNFDFEGDIDAKGGSAIAAGSDAARSDIYARAARMEGLRRKADDTTGGFFETPYPLAALMGNVGGVRPGTSLLEPSAGRGALLRLLPEGVNITAVEARQDNRDAVARLVPAAKVLLGDFMATDFGPRPSANYGDNGQKFDTVLMNPPFERLAGVGAQDVAHVMRAYNLLAPGGRLVSIMGEGAFFRDTQQEREFRQWLDDVGATVIQMPEGAFKQSGTGVRTRMVVIDQGGEAGRTDLDLHDMQPDTLRAIERLIPSRASIAQAGDAGDIKFSVAEPTKKGRERDLIIQHNLSIDNLLHSDRMGGIAVPSLAITRVDKPLENFGEITLLGDDDTATPSRDTKVFGADIYSPRYPTITYRIVGKVRDRINATLAAHRQDGDREYYGGGDEKVDDLTSYKPFQRYAAAQLGKADPNAVGYHQLRAIANDMLAEAGVEERIFRGFTDSGNRRYVGHTLDRVVDILRKELRGGENFNYGAGSLRAKFTPQFRSLKAVRDSKDRLIDKAAFEKIKEEVNAELLDLAEQMVPGRNDFRGTDTAISILEDGAKMGLQRAAKEYGIELSDTALENAREFLTKLRNMPTQYFEAKVLRAMQLSEFKAAVVPKDTPQKARDILRSAGLQVFDYDGEKDRARAVREAAENTPRVMFSVADSPEPFYSELARQVEKVGMNAAPAASWKAWLKGLPQKGVKPDEVAWTGVEEWLDLQTGKVTKAAVLDYLNANGVKVTETVLGGSPDIDTVRDKYMKAMVAEGATASRADQMFREMLAFARDHDHSTKLSDEGFELVMKHGGLTGNEIHDAVSGADPTKYATYQLPGGTSYREVLLTLPVQKKPFAEPFPKPLTELPPEYHPIHDRSQVPSNRWAMSKDGEISARPLWNRHPTPEAATAEAVAVINSERENAWYDAKRAHDQDDGAKFKSQHWDQPNVAAHYRRQDFVDARGRPGTVYIEFQSDWGQAGRKRGFISDLSAEALEMRELDKIPEDRLTETQRARARELLPIVRARGERDARFDAVPAAPFVTNTEAWVSLLVKRAIISAVNEGKEWVGIVNGEQAAGFYDLSKQVSRIEYVRNPSDGTYNVQVFGTESNIITTRNRKTASQLEDWIGKDLAKKIVDGEGEKFNSRTSDFDHRLSGLDLKIGDKGMKAFYGDANGQVTDVQGKVMLDDKGRPKIAIVPAVIKSVLKKLGGGELETFNIRVPNNKASNRLRYVGYTPTADEWKSLDKMARGYVNETVSPFTGKKLNYQINRVAVANETGMIGKAMERDVSFNDAMAEYGSPFLAEVLGGKIEDIPAAERKQDTLEQLGFTLTPAMREKAAGGLPLFSISPEASQRSEASAQFNREQAIDNLPAAFRNDPYFGPERTDLSGDVHARSALWDKAQSFAAQEGFPAYSVGVDDIGNLIVGQPISKAQYEALKGFADAQDVGIYVLKRAAPQTDKATTDLVALGYKPAFGLALAAGMGRSSATIYQVGAASFTYKPRGISEYVFSAVDGPAQPAQTGADEDANSQAQTQEAERHIGLLRRDIAEHLGMSRAAVDALHPYVAVRLPAAETLAEIARSFNTKLQGFGLRNGLLAADSKKFGFFDGVRTSGIVFVSASHADRPHLAILGHELVHVMATKNPDLYDRFVEAVWPYINQQKYRDEFLKLNVARKSIRPREEFMGEVLSDAFMDREFWRALGKKDPSLLQRVGEMLMRLVENALRVVGYRKRSEPYLTDYKRVMQIAADVMAEFGVAPEPDGDTMFGAADQTDSASDLRRPVVGQKRPQGRNGNASVQQGSADGVAGNIELLANFVETQAFREQGLRGLDVPTQRLVLSAVLAAIHEPKILQRVIRAVPVDVVNVLAGQQGPAEMLLHDPAVLQSLASINTNADVPKTIKAADALVRATAKHAAEWAGFDRAKSRNGALKASAANDTLESRHGVTPTSDAVLGTDGASTSSVPPILEQDEIAFSLTPEEESAYARAGLSPGRSLGARVRAGFGRMQQLLADRRELAAQARQSNLDQFHGIDRAIRRELGGLPAGQDPYVAARLANGGVSSVMRGLLLHGQAQWAANGQHLEKKPGTRGLLDILAPLGADPSDWFAWMIGNRAARLKREGRENNLSDADIKALRGRGAGKEVLFKTVAAEFAEFKRSVLDVAEGAGLIDADGRRVWDNADWIPFYRNIDDRATFSATGRKGLAGQSSGIRQLKGGKDALNDPLENLLMNFSRLIDASLKNNALGKTVRALDQTGVVEKIGYDFSAQILPAAQIKKRLIEAGTPEAVLDAIPEEAFEGMAKMWALQAPSDPDVVRVMVGGKPKFYRVNDPLLLQALTSFVPFTFPGLALMRGAKRLLTRMVTSTPEFMLANFIRDSLSSQAISRDSFSPTKSLSGIVKSYTESGAFEPLLFAGASFQAGHVEGGDPQSTARALRRSLRRRGMSAAGVDGFMATVADTAVGGVEKYFDVGDSIENANREAVYEATMKATGDATAAAYESKDLMDFSLRGSSAIYQVAADVLPFFNARVQGLYRLGRADPKRLAQVGLLIMAMSLLLAMANDGEDWYEELEDWDKDTYWHFKIAGRHFRAPKPFEVGAIFATLPERIGRSIKGLDSGRKTLNRLGHLLTDQLAFDPVPQAIAPAADVYMNKDRFRDRPIESRGDEGKLPHARYSAVTSDTTLALLDKTAPVTDKIGLSPKDLEFLVNGYFGTIGGYALAASDMLVRKIEGAPPRPETRLGDLPVVRRFYREDPARATVFESDLYKLDKDVAEIARTINAHRKSRTDLGEAKADALEAREEKKLDVKRRLDRATDRLGSLGKDRDEIMRDPSMTPKEKRTTIDELQRERNAIARETMLDADVKALQ